MKNIVLCGVIYVQYSILYCKPWERKVPISFCMLSPSMWKKIVLVSFFFQIWFVFSFKSGFFSEKRAKNFFLWCSFLLQIWIIFLKHTLIQNHFFFSNIKTKLEFGFFKKKQIGRGKKYLVFFSNLVFSHGLAFYVVAS